MVKSKVLGFIACTARSWHSISVRPSRFSIVSKRTHIHSDFFQHQVGPSLWFFVPNRRYKILTTRPSTGALNTWSRKKRVFRTKSLFTSESVDIRDRSVVTMDHYQKAEHQRHQILGTPTYANIYEQPNFACWPQTRELSTGSTCMLPDTRLGGKICDNIRPTYAHNVWSRQMLTRE